MDQALTGLPREDNPNVMIGYATADDAGVYRLTEECALVQTVDFFTPIVDDPKTFGAIAAANSLSDVYAMGGRPISALAITCWPARGEVEDLRAILHGGADKMAEAGCAVIGGHSVNDEEIKFGYAVTGIVHPERVLANAGARPGDVLFLTKPLGTGVISTALKRELASEQHVEGAIASMLALNAAAAQAALRFDVRGCTDVTGFGLLGHTREMAVASRVTIEIESRGVRFLPGAVEYAAAGATPGGLRNNREFVAPCVEVNADVPPEIEALLYDPQTSGGLLVAVSERDAADFAATCPLAFRVGRALEPQDKPIRLV